MVSRLLRRTRIAVSVALVVWAEPAIAQGTGIVRGRVVERSSERPLADVSVTILGSSLVGVTNTDGDYTIANVPIGTRTLTARRIGYARSSQPVSVIAGGEVRADFRLSETAS